MKKNVLKLILLILSISGIFFSCKKAIDNSVVDEEITMKVNLWLDGQLKQEKPNQSKKIQTLKSHLLYSEMEEIKGKRGSTLVIPIDNEFRSIVKISEKSILNLVASVNNDGTIRNMHVVVYTAPNEKLVNKLQASTFDNIFHTAENVIDGEYRFLTPSGSKEFQLEYKNGILASEGLYTTNPKKNNNIQTNDIKSNSLSCIDWYLVTTYYIDGIEVNQTSEYVTSTCTGCDSQMYEMLCPGDQSSGNSGFINYTFAKRYTRTWVVANINGLGIYKTNYFTIEDDYFITDLSFGPIGKSISDSTTKVETHAAYAQVNSNYTEAFTSCTALLTYASDPANPVLLPTGSRNWTVTQIKNP